jgi:hypothetical protein
MRFTSCFLGIGLLATMMAGCSQNSDQAFFEELNTRRQSVASASARSSADHAGAEDQWLTLGKRLRAEASKAASGQPVLVFSETGGDANAGSAPYGRGYVPYEKRRGPAYPGDIWHSLGRDAKEFVPMVWDDTKVVFTKPISLILLGASGAAGIALSGDRGNDQVARHFLENGGQLNQFWDQVGDVGGNPGLHFALAGAAYFGSQAMGDTKTYEVSKSMLSALSINGLLTMGLKVASRTESPNGDEFGWPSGHTSSSFCFAGVMYEHYGPAVGLPLYAFAAFVGYERIDARNHDFNDVISGALIGMAIGHAVAGNHQPKVLGMDVLPYSDPRGGVGILLMREF